MSEFYDHRKDRGKKMRLPPQTLTTNPQFHAALLGAKTMRAKLAACYHMLSQGGNFSDSGPEIWEMRQEVAEHLPAEIRSD